MGLSEQQLSYINDYLKKNKVDYWDVRMELLDHIAMVIENEIEKGYSFDHALMTAHLNFGNKARSKKLNSDMTQWIIEESIYADNSGYKKLIAEKQKELHKGIRKKLNNVLISFFTNPFTLILYVLLIFGLFQIRTTIPDTGTFFKIAWAILVFLAGVPVMLSVASYRKSFKTLYMNSLMSLPFLSIGLSNLFLYVPTMFSFGDDKGLSPLYITILYIVLFPLIVSEIKLFFSEFKKFRNIQKRFS